MSTIYAIVGHVTRNVKLGKTNGRTALRRMAALQMHSADTLVLLAEACKRPDRHEKHLHNFFAGYRLHGEWFSSHVTGVIEQALERQTFAVWLDSIVARYESLDALGPKIEFRK